MSATQGDGPHERTQALPLWKRLLYWAVTFGAMAIVVALLGEAMVRLFAPQPPVERWFEESEPYRYVLKKDFHQRFPFVGSDFVMDVRTNAFGLRDQEFDPAAPFDGKTILLIGDSFVFGYGINVENRFDTKLRLLISQARLPIRIINAGVPGWGTIQETSYAKDRLDLFKPDVIVLTFCGNDPHDDDMFTSGEMVYREGGLFWFPGKAFLRAHSQLYSFLLRSTTQLRRRIALRGQLDEAPRGPPRRTERIGHRRRRVGHRPCADPPVPRGFPGVQSRRSSLGAGDLAPGRNHPCQPGRTGQRREPALRGLGRPRIAAHAARAASFPTTAIGARPCTPSAGKPCLRSWAPGREPARLPRRLQRVS